MSPKITIVVSIYRSETYIRKCVDSIINQSLKEIEIILVDDGSSDRSGLICDEYAERDNRIKVIHKENGGDNSSRNAGLSAARGDYVGFVDGDDYVESDMYEVMYNVAIKEQVDIVNCGVHIESPSGTEKIATQFEKKKILTHSDLMTCLNSLHNRLEDMYWCWRNIYRKRLIDEIKINFDESFRYGPDTNFNFLVFFHAQSFYCVDQFFYHYVYHPSSIMNIRYKEQYLEELSKTYNKRLAICRSIGLDNVCIVRGVSTTVIEKHLFLLLVNAWENPRKGFIKQLKAIRNSEMVSVSFVYYQKTRKLPTAMQSIIYLMKFRMYYLVLIVFAVSIFKRNFAS